MSFDLATHLGLVSRRVESLTHEGQPAKAVVLSRRYDTDPGDLWAALTTADRLRRWFLPVSGELRLGGRYQFEGNAGGTVTECEPPRRLAATWEFGGAVSWVHVTLTGEADGTRLELRHIAPLSPHWEQFGPGAVGVGWDLGIMGLARHLADPSIEVPPEAAAEWATSQEARDGYSFSARAWGEAAIADGEDPEHARKAAEATRAFYCGEAPPAA